MQTLGLNPQLRLLGFKQSCGEMQPLSPPNPRIRVHFLKCINVTRLN